MVPQLALILEEWNRTRPRLVEYLTETGKLEKALEKALESAAEMMMDLSKRGYHPIVAKRLAKDRYMNLPKESEVPTLDWDQAPFGQP